MNARALALIVACGLASAAPAMAFPIIFSEADALATGAITKTQAIAIALKRVGGGRAVSAEYTNDGHVLHWQVEIVNGTHAYEVWVSPAGVVLKVIVER